MLHFCVLLTHPVNVQVYTVLAVIIMSCLIVVDGRHIERDARSPDQ